MKRILSVFAILFLFGAGALPPLATPARATVSTTTNSTTALGNGVTTIFTYAFPMVNASYAQIVYTDADGVATTLTPSQYTLVINSNGGTVTYPLAGSPIASGTSLTISRIVPYIQTTSIASQGPTFRAIENALDYLTYEVQQVANGVAASFSDAFFEIFNAGDPTKKIKFFAGDITTGTTSTYAFPDGSADVVTDTATQTLTNKTLTAPVITGLTQYNVLVGGGSGDIVKIPPGAASTVLASNGAGANPSFQAFGGGGSVTSITFADGLTADFNPCVASCTAGLEAIVNNSLLGNSSGGAATPIAQTVGTGLSLSTGVLSVSSIDSSLLGTSTITEPLNFAFTASVGSSALTIAVKGQDGNDPSASNPVKIPFPNQTGGYDVISLTGATSLAVSSGSTLGTANAVLARLWIVGFNDSGTFRLGIVNTQISGGIFPLAPANTASSTAEGGAGGADSAGVFYTGTAVADKAYAILGFIEATQATAGTWATAPSKAVVYKLGMPLPGTKIFRHFFTPVAASGTTDIPDDNTTPLIGEGTQIWTQAVTPQSAANRISIEAVVNGMIVSGNSMVITLYRGSTLVSMVRGAPSDVVGYLSMNWIDTPASAASQTYSMNVGRGTAGGTWYVSQASAAKYNGAYASNGIAVYEIVS